MVSAAISRTIQSASPSARSTVSLAIWVWEKASAFTAARRTLASPSAVAALSAGTDFLELEESDDADRLHAHRRIGIAQRFERRLERIGTAQLLERTKRRHAHEAARMGDQREQRIGRRRVLELGETVGGGARDRGLGIDHRAGERRRGFDPVIFAERQRDLPPHAGVRVQHDGGEQRDGGGIAGMAELHHRDPALAGVGGFQPHRELVEIVILLERIGHGPSLGPSLCPVIWPLT